jgi:transcriptional antiterminator RfaH
MHPRRTHLDHVDRDLCWLLLYTKARAESWADINLRKQGFATLLPRVQQRDGFGPLFPRYLFVGAPIGTDLRPTRSTRGVLYVVHCGDKPARVPVEVVEEIRARMDEHGVVELERRPLMDSLFARRERERVRTLVKLAQAGFRVVA